MSDIAALVADNLDVWTGAIERKSGAGRAGGKRISLYGIDRLRSLILDLAVRGKLLPQDAGDEPASELLKRVDKKRAHTFPKLKATPSPTADNINTVIPLGWETVRLDRLANSQAGFAFKSKGFNEVGAGLPLIRIRDVGQPFTGTFYAGDYREEFVVTEGDYLISMDGEFRVATWPGPAALLNQRVSRLQFYGEQTARAFVAMVLQRELKKLQGVKAYTTVDHLSGKQIAETNIVLPPLAEQQRIVAKVDELMALCDALECESAKAMAAHQALVEILLATLVNSADATDLARDWARLERHFDTLFTTDVSIDALKQTILDLAVRGKLVEQNVGDEGVNLPGFRQVSVSSDLDSKVFERGKNLFRLPKDWMVAPLAQVSLNIIDCPHTTPKWTEAGELCVRTNQIKPRHLDLSCPNYVSAATYEERIERLEPAEGDILYIREGGILGVGCRIPANLKLCLGQRSMLIRCNKAISSYYLEIAINSPFIVEQAAYWTTGGAAPRVNMSTVRGYPIPIPPLAEQHRIVAKVDALMALCDALKAGFADAVQSQRHLADAITQRAAA